MREYWAKARSSPAGKTPNPAVSGHMSKDLDGSALPALMLHCASLYFLCMQLSLTDIPHLQCPGIFNATQASITQCHTVFPGLHGVLACHTHGLGGGRLHNPFTFVSFLTLKPEAYGQPCQDLLPLELQLKQHSFTVTI